MKGNHLCRINAWKPLVTGLLKFLLWLLPDIALELQMIDALAGHEVWWQEGNACRTKSVLRSKRISECRRLQSRKR